ncbi:hypothetical protein BAY1663_04698 [Pseudomonas sp. BAY1663]|nr:hypothetical protein BAY1663_04698 [Pseudomonas sp. BAY1663]
MEDFHLAQRRMGDVHFQRAIIVRQRHALVRQPRAQAQDVVLQGMQQAVVAQVSIFGIQADLLAAEAEQRIEEIAALLAEAGQQRVADVEVPVVRSTFRLPRQLAHIADLAPGLAARVERADHHVDVPRQAVEHPQVVRRQAADAEHQQPLGQPGECFVAIQALQQVAEQPRAVRVAVLGQLAPEQRLPGFVGTELEGLAALPGRQPVVAVEQVLVEGVGDFRRQAQPPALVAAVQVLRQARRQRQVGRLAQPAVETPGQAGRGECRLLRQAAEHRTAEVPDEAGRQLDVQLHGDALLACQLQGQPAAHALARHHHPRRGEGVGQRLGEQRGSQFAQGFQVGSMVEAEHGRTAENRSR